MSPDDLAALVFETVDRCLTKTDKVIVSLIVDREDEVEYRAKADAVNALIKLKYMNNTNISVCSHDNLRERKYKQRRDLLHLTTAGTSRLANNMKYCIAKSLGIEVAKKRVKEDDVRNDRNIYERQNGDRQVWNNRHEILYS